MNKKLAEEAIDIIKKYDVNGCGYCHQGDNEVEEAFNMAIKALEYDDVKYHEDRGEVVVDKAVWEDVKKALEQSHDGCKDCKYETYPDSYYPCCDCKKNYVDKWQMKEGD